jgi:Zn-dependent protease with chaperone function
MNGPDERDDKPGSFSADNWEQPRTPDRGSAPDAPNAAPGSFSSSEPTPPAPQMPQQPRISVPSIAELVLGVPWLIWSFGVVCSISVIFFNGFLAVLVVALWLLSGFLILWPPMEDYLARYLFRLRRPTMLEQQKLDIAWRAVCARVNINPQYYHLWIEEADSVNGYAMAGRTIAVTRWALNALPPRQLQAVLAHELGHHRGGHPWAALVAFWYALPGRMIVGAVRAILRRAAQVPALGCLVGGVLFLGFAGLFLDSLIFGHGWGWAFYAILPFLVPIPLAWFSRRTELAADMVAAELGYGRDTVTFLYDLQAQGEDVVRRAAGWRGVLYSTHPSVADRITALERYLQGGAA